jgi:predicted secreted protein
LAAVVTIAVVRREIRRAGRAGLVSPISLFFVSWLVFLFVVGLADFGPATHDPLLPGGTHELLVGYAVAAVALLLVAVGYCVATYRSRFPRITELHRITPLSRSTVYVLLLVGWASRFVGFQQGSYGYLGWGTPSPNGLVARLLQLADGLVPLVIAAVALELWQSRPVNPRWHRVLLITNVLALALVSLGSGIKGQVLVDLVPVGIVYVISRGRVPLRAIVVLALLVVVEYSGVQAFRLDITTGTVNSANRRGIGPTVGAVVDRVGHSWSTKPPQDHLREAWDGFVSEYSITIRTVAIIVHDTPSDAPFLGTRRLVVGPIFFLPSRALGGVHTTDVGEYVQTTYLRGPPTSSAAAPQPGDF